MTVELSSAILSSVLCFGKQLKNGGISIILVMNIILSIVRVQLSKQLPKPPSTAQVSKVIIIHQHIVVEAIVNLTVKRNR